MGQKIKEIIEFNKIIDTKVNKKLDVGLNIVACSLSALIIVVLALISTILSTIDIRTGTILLDIDSPYFDYVFGFYAYTYSIIIITLSVVVISYLRIKLYRLKYGDGFFKGAE